MPKALEIRLISGLIQHPELFAEVSGIIGNQHFTDPHCTDIMKFMESHETSDQDILLPLMPEKYRGMLSAFEDGEPVRRGSLIEAAKALKIDHAHQTLSKAFSWLGEASTSREMPIEALCSTANKYILQAMSVLSADSRGLQPFESCVKKALEYVVDVHEGRVPLTKTGITWLDNVVGAMGETELVVIGARPSVGKSAIGLQIALAASKSVKKSDGVYTEGVSTAYFTMEMSSTMLTLRALFGKAGFTYGEFLRNGLTQENIGSLRSACNEMPKALSISDTPAPSVSRIRSELLRRPDTKLVIIDHLHIMSGEDNGGGLYQKLTEISGDLKKLAMELKVPIILLAQLNRGSAQEETEPSEHNLRDSGAIEQDADRIYLLHRPKRDDPEFADQDFDPALILVKKNRNGASARIKCFFEKTNMTFRECTRADAMYDENSNWETVKKRTKREPSN